jgi:D-glycero-alpha-D-manno-heptose 1-phosphate guanylyltransferase
MIDAIILAGGLGTRLRKAVPNVPKPLAPIQGVPFLDLLIDQIERSGVVKKIVLAVGYRAEEILKHFEIKPRRTPLLFSNETAPLGTGGAIRQAISYTDSDHVYVFNGDSYLNCSLCGMLTHFRSPMTMAFTRVADASRFGQLEIDSQNRIRAFREKENNPNPGWINGGIYLFDRKVFERSWPEAFSLEKDLFPLLLSEGIFGFQTDGLFIDIGTPESFAFAQTVFNSSEPDRFW